MFQNELFEVEEGSFVGDLLAHLDDGSPCVRCEALCTIWTLVVCNDILDLEGLLENRPLKRLLLDSDFHFYSSRMRFRPDEARIYDSNLRYAS